MKNINFFGITNTMGMPNRGPIIQTQMKMKYFKRDITKFDISFENAHKNPDWVHILNPACKYWGHNNVSAGPNIFLKYNQHKWIYDKHIVADSQWMKDYLIKEFRFRDDLISVIPIYVSEDFYTTQPEKHDVFTVGIIGYYQNDDIKNFDSLVKICAKFPQIKFELLSSRNKNQFPSHLQNIENINFINVPHNEVHMIAKKWACYVGLSKRERGPASVQEMKVLGIPTICPNHTGYTEFKPMFALDIEPFVSHTDKDIQLFVDAIDEIFSYSDKYLEMAIKQKETFWNNEKSTTIISKKWEDFFKNCLGEK